MNKSFLSKLTPKEPQFFPLLKEMTEAMLIASDLIIKCVQTQDHESHIEFYKKIKEQEKRGDRLSNQIFDDLNTTFITPFDREDINKLANQLDNVIDDINSCAKRIVLYSPKQLPENAVDLAKLIREAAICIGKAVEELDQLKKDANRVKDHSRELHDIENRADDVYEHFIIALFEKEKDGIEIIKLKEIMLELEKATDAAEYVGKVINTIIIKYA